MIHGFLPPSPYQMIDTLIHSQKIAAHSSHKLDWLGQLIRNEGKLDTDYDLWVKCEQGDQESLDYMCITPDHKILTQDLKWIPIGELNIGDKILGFDEEGPHRHFKGGIVTNNKRKISKLYEVEFENGDKIKCTPNHKWLTAGYSPKNDRIYNFNFKTTEEIFLNGVTVTGKKTSGPYSNVNTRIPKVLNTWSEIETKEIGWLAGMFDGEGSLHNVKYYPENMKKNRGFTVDIVQKQGNESDKIKSILDKYGYSYKIYVKIPKEKDLGNKTIDCYSINGGFHKKMKFLGEVRPERLINNLDFAYMTRLESRNLLQTIKSIKEIPDGEVVALETTCGTYIAEGYPMHNCSYNKEDVGLLEETYLWMRPWMNSHPNIGLYMDLKESVCSHCGSIDLKNDEYYFTPAGKYATVRCNSCGAIGRYRTSALTLNESKLLTRSTAR